MEEHKSTRQVGKDSEAIAAAYLKQQGMQILEQNFYSRFGEIDIIAKDGDCLVFAEVKYRKNDSCGDPSEAVDYRKQKKICKTALYYCKKQGYEYEVSCRFDVITVSGDGTIWHLKNAFEYCG